LTLGSACCLCTPYGAPLISVGETYTGAVTGGGCSVTTPAPTFEVTVIGIVVNAARSATGTVSGELIWWGRDGYCDNEDPSKLPPPKQFQAQLTDVPLTGGGIVAR